MAGRTVAEAIDAFVQPIQRALTCFADGKVTTDSHDPGVSGRLVFNRGDDVELNGPGRVHLSVLMHYRLVHLNEPVVRGKPWKVSTEGWIYHLSDRDTRPIVEFHWHPEFDILFPHLHISAERERHHYPTGRVLIEDVLNCAIEYGAEPRDSDKWQAVHGANVENFAKGATWGTHTLSRENRLVREPLRRVLRRHLRPVLSDDPS